MGFKVLFSERLDTLERGVRHRLERLAEDLRSLGQVDPVRTYFFEPLGNGFFRKRIDNYRLFAYRYPPNEVPQPTLLFLHLLHRNDREYETLLEDTDRLQERFGATIAEHRPEAVKASQNAPGIATTILAPPPAGLSQFLEPITPHEPVQTFYITEQCVDRLRDANSEHKTEVRRFLYRLANDPSVIPTDRCCRQRLGGIELHYSPVFDYRINAHHIILWWVTESESLFSETPIDPTSAFHKWYKFWEEYDRHLGNTRSGGTEWTDVLHDLLSRYADRAFPWYVLCEPTLFDRVLTDKETFLPLSVEEMNKLYTTLFSRRLPAVIEGRAGSGKSTILTYCTCYRVATLRDLALPAEYYPILYVTQSEKLLEVMKSLIDGLYRHIADLHGTQYNENCIKYMTFHQFAYSRLPLDQKYRFVHRQRSSRDGGWIDFARFRDMLRNRCPDGLRDAIGQRVSPEAAWFVIRSYIKGYKVDQRGNDRWLTPEEYVEDVARKDRQVSPEMYKVIWDRVWPWYRQLTTPHESNGGEPRYWDDTDLAWCVLEYPRNEGPWYAVIICDESQDLTRVELSALVQASAWTKHDLRDLENEHRSLPVPILLAGDAHQTVNPSCFRWDRVRSDVTKALVSTSPLTRTPVVQVEELEYNYRNAPSIAKLCNVVQAFRQQVLQRKDKLQKIWRLPDAVPNQRVRRLIVDRSTAKAPVSMLIDNGVLLVGPEDDDPQLKEVKQFWANLGVSDVRSYENYVVPSEIKGREHRFIAVLGFGAHFTRLQLDNIWNWSRTGAEDSINEDRRLTAEYFLNNLYVALSRPREQLWIVDTQEGWDRFWKPLEEWSRFQHHLPQDIVEFTYSDGDVTELLKVFSGEHLYLAKQFEEQAHEAREPKAAERATYYYRLANRPLDAERMLAYAKYYEGHIEEAAIIMLRVDIKTASDWFWECEQWSQLTKHDTLEWRRNLATLMNELDTAEDQKSIITELWRHVFEHWQTGNPQRDIESLKPKSRPWLTIVGTILSYCASNGDTEMAEFRPHVHAVANYVLNYVGDPSRRRQWDNDLGKLAFAYGDWSKAITHWDRAGNSSHESYYVAKASTTGYPECLRWWESAGKWDIVLEQYEANSGITLSSDDLRRVGRAAAQRGRWRLALASYAQVDDHAEVVPLWPKSLEAHATSSEACRSLIEGMYEGVLKGVVKERSSLRWTDLLVDLLLAVLSPSHPQIKGLCPDSVSHQMAKLSPEVRDYAAEAIVYGFGLDHSMDGLMPRILGSWVTKPVKRVSTVSAGKTENKPLVGRGVQIKYIADRLEWQFSEETGREGDSTSTETNWKVFDHLIQEIILKSRPNVYSFLAKSGREQAANLTYLVLSLLWTKYRVGRAPSEDDPYVLQPYLWDEDRLAEYVDAKASPKLPNDMSVLSADKWPMVEAALRLIGEAPADWLRGDIDFQKGKFLAGFVDKLSEQFVYEVPHSMTSGAGFLGQDKLSEHDIEPLEKCLVIGQFVEHAPSRRRAIHYYLKIREVAEQLGYPRDMLRRISDRLTAYEQRDKKEKEEKPAAPPSVRHATPSEERQSRPFGEEHLARLRVIHVNPSAERRSKWIRVLNVEPRRPKECQVEFVRDSYRVRLQINSDDPSYSMVHADPELTVTDLETAGAPSWEIKSPSCTIRVSWRPDKNSLYIDADERFVVPFARTSEFDGNRA